LLRINKKAGSAGTSPLYLAADKQKSRLGFARAGFLLNSVFLA
jgi:hypothetical protein